MSKSKTQPVIMPMIVKNSILDTYHHLKCDIDLHKEYVNMALSDLHDRQQQYSDLLQELMELETFLKENDLILQS